MSRVAAVICEFNPLHNGHKRIIDMARERGDTVAAIMSGNFTERSECAVFDKYKRAEAAIKAGADIVFELPFPWCSAGGEGFALGGVGIAAGVGAEALVFGSESGDIEKLKRCAGIIAGDGFRELMKNENVADVGAAAAFDSIMKKRGYSLGGNDKLGIQYIRAGMLLGAKLSYVTRRRESGEGYMTSTELRELIKNGVSADGYIYPAAAEVYGTRPDIDTKRLEELEYLFFRAFSRPDGDFAEGGGGLYERLVSAAQSAPSYGEFYREAQTKKYTSSRIRRAALYAVTGIKKEHIRVPPKFTVLLAANGRGREYLSEIRYGKRIRIITKPSAVILDGEAAEQYERLMAADEIYSLCLAEGKPYGEYARRSPYIE